MGLAASSSCCQGFDGLQGRAWRAWVEYIQGQHADKARARAAAAFWQNHQAAVALRQWQQQVVIVQEMKARAAIIVGKLRNSVQVCLCTPCAHRTCLLCHCMNLLPAFLASYCIVL